MPNTAKKKFKRILQVTITITSFDHYIWPLTLENIRILSLENKIQLLYHVPIFYGTHKAQNFSKGENRKEWEQLSFCLQQE